jgi:hypothetical protein
MWINKSRKETVTLSNCVGINHRVASVVVQRRSSLEEYPSDERLNMISPRSEFPYLAAFLMQELPSGHDHFEAAVGGWVL